jgi:hypothetical protein
MAAATTAAGQHPAAVLPHTEIWLLAARPSAPRLPWLQWYTWRLEGGGNDLDVVNLASETAPPSLVADAPSGITRALKLVTLAPSWDFEIFAGVFYPPASLTIPGTVTGTPGLFNGVSAAARASRALHACPCVAFAPGVGHQLPH